MRVIVKRLYNRGVRRSDREIQNDPGQVGVMTCATVETRRRMKVHAIGDDSQMRPILPELFDPAILAVGNSKMLLRGVAYANPDDAPGAPKYEQEWSLRVLDSTYVPD